MNNDQPGDDHIRPSIRCRAEQCEIEGACIDIHEWRELRMSSYEQEFLMQFVDNETLVDIARRTVANCEPFREIGPASTYDEFAVHRLIPELIRRLR